MFYLRQTGTVETWTNVHIFIEKVCHILSSSTRRSNFNKLALSSDTKKPRFGHVPTFFGCFEQ